MHVDDPQLAPLLGEVEVRMRELVAGPEGDLLATIASEHLATGGKRLRARLALGVGLALGANPDSAVAWAASCELAHNATLIHDDLQDGDRLRRGQPTCWVRHGMAQAINAGDLLLMAAVAGAAGAGRAHAGHLTQLLAAGMVTVIRGQALECELMRRPRIDAELYRRIVAQKTAALFELPAHGAARLAGLGAEEAARVAAAFARLGVLFQLQDDVVDLFGDKGREAPGADLKEGKVSALVVAHCRLHPGDEESLMATLRAPRARTSRATIARVSRAFAERGALAAVLAEMDGIADRARAEAPGALATMMASLVERVRAPIAHLWVGA